MVDESNILTQEEIAEILRYTRQDDRGIYRRIGRAIFRLGTGAGLRACEVTSLKMQDVVVTGPHPQIRLARENVKGKKRARNIPLTWDRGTLFDLAEHKRWRESQGAGPEDLFVVKPDQSPLSAGSPLGYWVGLTYRTMGKERASQVRRFHDARHTFASWALHMGRSVVEVKNALGHHSLATTSIYAHLIPGSAPDLYPSGSNIPQRKAARESHARRAERISKGRCICGAYKPDTQPTDTAGQTADKSTSPVCEHRADTAPSTSLAS
jgi:integrase